jgi:hypothetical protein
MLNREASHTDLESLSGLAERTFGETHGDLTGEEVLTG